MDKKTIANNIIHYIVSNNKNTKELQKLLNKFTQDKLLKLYDNIKQKLETGYTKDQILNCYDIYEPIANTIIKEIENKFVYRYGQDIAHNEFKNILELASYWGLLICPTGYGKSILHNLFIASYWNKYNKNIMLITKRKDILQDQLCTLNDKLDILKLNGILKNNFVVLDQVNSFNCNKINKCNNNTLIVINIDKLINNYEFIKWDKIGFTIFDEVHWLSGKETFIMANNIKKHVKFCIGSSATPIRADKESQENIKKLFGDPLNVLYEISYIDAWKNNIIVPIYHKYFVINKGLYNIKETEGKVKYDFKKEAKDIISNNMVNYLNQTIYKKCICFCRDKKSLVEWRKYLSSVKTLNNYNIYVSFTKDKKICKHIEKIKLDNLNEFDQINDFKRCPNNAILLVVFRANEGFDDPFVEIVADLDFVEVRSPLFLLQKIGRAQRICNNKKCGYYLSPIIGNDKMDTLNYISNLLYDYVSAVSNVYNDSCNKGKKDNDNIVELISKYISIDNFFDVNHEDIINNIELLIQKDGFSCKNAMSIIRSYINKGIVLESKENYYELCKQDSRLPLEPEVVFNNFPGWITYLNINKNNYYGDVNCTINSVNKIISASGYVSLYPLEIYEYCRTIDTKLPPMPVDFYKDNGINNICCIIKSNAGMGKLKRRMVLK